MAGTVADIFSEAELHALCKSHEGLTTVLLLLGQKCQTLMQKAPVALLPQLADEVLIEPTVGIGISKRRRGM